MSRLLLRERARRCALPLALGVSAAFAFGLSLHPACAQDTAASLYANPKRLEEVQAGCRTNQPWATDALCRQAAEAIRRRFRGGGVPYRPWAVDPFPTHPQIQPNPAAPTDQSPPPKPQAHAAPTPPRAPRIL